jgi:hypothetical protein
MSFEGDRRILRAPLVHGRYQARDERRRVHERARERDRKHQANLRSKRIARRREDVTHDEIDDAGLVQCRRDDEEDGDAQDAFIGKAGQGVLGCQDAGQEQDGESAAENDVGPDAAEDHQTEAAPEHSEGNPEVDGHEFGAPSRESRPGIIECAPARGSGDDIEREHKRGCAYHGPAPARSATAARRTCMLCSP